jgi:hypothetical protein
MLTTLFPIRLAARHLAGGVLFTLLAGCGSDDLLLPKDGEPAELRAVSGDQQSAPAGDPIDHPLIVEALDRAGRPVPGAVIVFAFLNPPNGAELVPANTETDDAGRASAEVKLGTPAGDQSVEARLDHPASELSVRFRLIALQPNGGGGDEGGGGDGDGGGGGGGHGDGDGDDGGNGGDGDDDEEDDDEGEDSRDGEGKGKGKGKG